MLGLCLAFSAHFGLSDGWNEVHPCLRYEYNNWTIGAFVNSENRLSVYGSHTWADVVAGIGLEAGIVTGYSGFPVVPMARFLKEMENDVWLFLAPVPAKENVGFVLGVEFKFGGGN